MQRKKAFTLIELLVVIAIIAILAAILFPVFAQAKMAAKKASDIAQCKQIGTSIQIYLGDYDDTYPLESVGTYGNDWNGHTRWSANEVLQPYVKNVPIFKSPGDSNTVNLPSWLTSYPQFSGSNLGKFGVNSYAANALAFAQGYDDYTIDPMETLPGSQAGLFGPGPSYAVPSYDPYPAIGTATNSSQVEYVSELIMIMDGGADIAQYYQQAYGVCGGTTTTQMSYVCDEDIAKAWVPLWFAVNYFGGPDIKTVWREYANGANFVFADSSAKTLKPGNLVKGGLYLNQHRWLVTPGQ